jgi:hypothetical protein
MTAQPEINYDQLIDKYIKLRDKKAEIQKAQKAELAKFDSALLALERIFLAHMQATGAKSVTSCTIADRDVFLRFVKQGDNWAFADLRANAPAVKAYLEANEELPPGVNFVSRLTVNVQR